MDIDEMETNVGDDAPMYHSVGHHISSHMCVSMTSTYNVVGSLFQLMVAVSNVTQIKEHKN